MQHTALIRKQWWLALLVIPVVWAAVLLALRFWFELQGTLHDDVHTYLAVGRGMLNGLTPYADLFESKPPGVFLLAAASVKFFGGAGLIKFVTAMAVLVIPTCTVALVWEQLKDREEATRMLWLALTFVFGAVMTHYAFREAGQGLIEPLGAAMCLVFAVLFVRTGGAVRLIRTIILSIPILIAVGLKEPFLFVLIAQALLLKRDWAHFRHAFLIPLAAAAAIGIAALAVLGYLGPYITIYLRHMLGFHLNQLVDLNGPFLLRGLFLHKTLWHMWDYSLPFVMLIVGMMVGTAILAVWNCVKKQIANSKKNVKANDQTPGDGNSTIGPCAFFAICNFLFAIYLILLAIGTGGDFFAHHFVFGTAGWIAVWAVFVRGMQSFGGYKRIAAVARLPNRACGTCNWRNAVAMIVLVLLIGALAWHRNPTFDQALATWETRYAMLSNAASTIDTVMDRCEWDRYLHITNKGGSVFGFTRHSPYGPIFIQFNRFIDGNPMYRERFRDALEQTPIMVLRSDRPTNLTDVAKAYVNEHFSFTPPPCAGAFAQPEPYRMVFRRVP